jgi:hypothetical protein
LTTYNSIDFYPPAPSIDVEVSVAGKRGKKKVVPMLLDLGADMTCLPQDIMTSMGKLRGGSIEVYGYSRRPTIQETGFFDFKLTDQEFDEIEVLPARSDYGLLGRDILNQLILRLDGPRLLWSILEA